MSWRKIIPTAAVLASLSTPATLRVEDAAPATDPDGNLVELYSVASPPPR